MILGAILLALLLRPVSPQTQLHAPLGPLADGVMGLVLALVILGLESSLSRIPGRIWAGGFLGATLGILAGRLGWSVWVPEPAAGTWVSTYRTLSIVALLYLGAAIGAAKGRCFKPIALRTLWQGEEPRIPPKIIDTSVIIDGRLRDIIEAGFLDGRILVPQFVLRELQQVADSPDALKRARGRKGLESLQNMKNLPNVQIEITHADFPEVGEVDLKLLELARRTSGKVVTNDFNLNRVARVRDIPVLNINDLANALRPVVLPGEPMRVFILKEGKEPNQGVAYLEDGTMVVVDDGKDLVGQTVDIVVTSLLQTTAGKMFFGRSDQAAMRTERRNALP
ncbi:MAG: PIN/TRAM domain-containing protein [Acidobacteriota bacterium]